MINGVVTELGFANIESTKHIVAMIKSKLVFPVWAGVEVSDFFTYFRVK